MLESLRKIPLFSQLADADLQRLAATVKEVRLPADTAIFSEGDPGDRAYLIRRGWVEISKLSGEHRVLLAVRREGEVIGEMAVLEHAPRMASARTVTECELLAIGEEQLDDLLGASPSAARAMLHTVSSRLKDTEGMLLQNEKMAQLGTLAAGMAHELNNPAAAALRGADHLRGAIGRLEAAQARIQASRLSTGQRQELERLLEGLRGRAEQPDDLGGGEGMGALDRADREEAVEDWLREQGLNGTPEWASELVALGYAPADLQRLHEGFGAQNLGAVLERLLATYASYALLAELARGAQGITRIVGALRRYIYHDQAPEQDVDIHEGLDNTLIMLRGRLKGGVSVNRDYAPDLPRLRAYGSELNQVWTNLIGNAVDAMEGKGHISLCTRREGGWVVVEVEDDGPGIPEELQPRVFSPFFTTKPVGSGTGLGLNICFNIVRKHGGDLSFRSRPGQTVFEVRLPLDFSGARSGSLALPGRTGGQDETIRRILLQARTVAVIGSEGEGNGSSGAVLEYLRGQGYRVVRLGEAAGGERDGPPDRARADLVLVFLPAGRADGTVSEALRLGARALWLQHGTLGAEAQEAAEQAGLVLVMDRCVRSEHQRLLGSTSAPASRPGSPAEPRG